MNEIKVGTDLLKKSVSNVRAGHTKEDIKQMANSIKHRGIINPPTVALNGDGKYEIIAGQLRVAGAIASGLEEIVCFDASKLDKTERVALSLSENFDRAPMGELETYKAFAKLFKAGLSVDAIADQFSRTPDSVQRSLAIGTLPKKILDAAERDEIGDKTLRALAVASGKDVTRFAKLAAKDRPRDWQINEWLYQDGQYLASHASFNLDDYNGGQITDLFTADCEVWLTDGTQFWELQHKAIAELVAVYEKKGWKVEQVDYFQDWLHDRTSKKNGGKVIYTVDERTGAVKFHVGYLRQKAAGKAPAAKGEEGKKQAKPEISKAFADFMAETRHCAVQAFMVQNKRAGLVGTLVLLLKEADNIQFRNGGPNLSDAYGDSLHSSDNFIYIHDAYCDMCKELGLKVGHTWDMDVKKLVLKLDEYTPAQLLEWITLATTYKWETIGIDTTDILGAGLDIEQVTNWVADDAFWNGLTNKKTMLAIAKENSITMGPEAPLKGMRARLKDKVPSSWRPKWLKF